MRTLNIYFDYTKVGGNTVIGAVAYEGSGGLRHVFKKIEKLSIDESRGMNQFHYTIKAMNLGITELKHWIKQNKIRDLKVVLLNQNHLIFKWLSEQSYGMDYMESFEILNMNLFDLLDIVDFEYREITGKDNRVKKILKTEASMIKVDNQSLNFSLLRERLSENKSKVEERQRNMKVSGENNIVELNKFKV